MLNNINLVMNDQFVQFMFILKTEQGLVYSLRTSLREVIFSQVYSGNPEQQNSEGKKSKTDNS